MRTLWRILSTLVGWLLFAATALLISGILFT